MNDEIKMARKPEWLNLFDKFKDLEYGTIITYEDMNSLLLDGDIKTNKRYVFEKFKKEMLKQEMKYLECIHNQGYRICNPNEHVRLTNKEIKFAERRARQAVNIILNTNMTKLTDREQAVARLAAARVQPIYATLVGEQKALQTEAKQYQLPKVPRM